MASKSATTIGTASTRTDVLRRLALRGDEGQGTHAVLPKPLVGHLQQVARCHGFYGLDQGVESLDVVVHGKRLHKPREYRAPVVVAKGNLPQQLLLGLMQLPHAQCLVAHDRQLLSDEPVHLGMVLGIGAAINIEHTSIFVQNMVRFDVVHHAMTLPDVQIQTTVHGRSPQQIRHHRHGQSIAVLRAWSAGPPHEVRLMDALRF